MYIAHTDYHCTSYNKTMLFIYNAIYSHLSSAQETFCMILVHGMMNLFISMFKESYSIL